MDDRRDRGKKKRERGMENYEKEEDEGKEELQKKKSRVPFPAALLAVFLRRNSSVKVLAVLPDYC